MRARARAQWDAEDHVFIVASTCQIEEGLDRIDCIPVKSPGPIGALQADNRGARNRPRGTPPIANRRTLTMDFRGGEIGGTLAEILKRSGSSRQLRGIAIRRRRVATTLCTPIARHQP